MMGWHGMYEVSCLIVSFGVGVRGPDKFFWVGYLPVFFSSSSSSSSLFFIVFIFFSTDGEQSVFSRSYDGVCERCGSGNWSNVE